VFINHIYALEERGLPPFSSYLLEYVTAANGIFVRARRPGLEALQPVCWNPGLHIRGLAQLEPYVRVEKPVPAAAIRWSLDRAYEAMPNEVLLWMSWHASGQGWRVYRPEQRVTRMICRPTDPSDPRGQEALVDLHSHHRMPPFFSLTDDRDESSGFRLYAVIGHLDTAPAILVRVGIFGHFSTIPASSVMELPDGLRDHSQGTEDLAICMPQEQPDGVNDGTQP
jgi:PRTRC genetic system protein A